MDADYTFYVKSIETHVRTFLPLNISAVSSVTNYKRFWFSLNTKIGNSFCIFTFIKYLAFTISTCGKTCSSIGEFQYWISIFNMPCESLRLFVQNWKYLKVNLLFVMKFEVWIFFEFCWIIDIQIHKFLSKLTHIYVKKKVKITRKVMTSFVAGTYVYKSCFKLFRFRQNMLTNRIHPIN